MTTFFMLLKIKNIKINIVNKAMLAIIIEIFMFLFIKISLSCISLTMLLIVYL